MADGPVAAGEDVEVRNIVALRRDAVIVARVSAVDVGEGLRFFQPRSCFQR
jgi:hypothetical protein